MSDERSSPVLVRWVLGEWLRELREARKLRASDVAAELGWAPSKLSRIENHEGVAPGDVHQLLYVYGVTDPADVRPLAEMARAGQQRGWWQQGGYGDVLPQWFATFVGLEAGAAEERDYKGALVTGLLQTPQYAKAIMTSAGPASGSPRPGQVERLISLRLERQQMLHRATDPLRLWSVMDEAVLAWNVGGPAVMREQLRHLADMAEADTVTLQILPGGHVHPALDFPFCVLRFGEAAPGRNPVPGLVYLENFRKSLIIEDAADVTSYLAAFDDLTGRALDPAESRALVLERLKALDEG